MKNIVLCTMLITFGLAQAQGKPENIQKIGVYLVDWQARPAAPPSMRNGDKAFRYYFESENIDLYHMFYDYSDQDKSMDSYPLLTDSLASHWLNAMVKFEYLNDTLVVYFDINGNYYYKKKWHKRPNELYYQLFHYFSNALIPEKIIMECKEKYRGDFWYED